MVLPFAVLKNTFMGEVVFSTLKLKSLVSRISDSQNHLKERSSLSLSVNIHVTSISKLCLKFPLSDSKLTSRFDMIKVYRFFSCIGLCMDCSPEIYITL